MDNKKQILIVGPDALGGITSVIKMHMNGGLKNEADFLPSYLNKSFILNLLYFPIFLLIFIFKLIAKEYKIVHIHTSSRGSFIRKSIVLLFAKLLGKKTIIHIHGSEFEIFYNNSSFLLKKYISKILNAADKIFVLSKEWKEIISKLCSNENITILYNPLELKEMNEQNSNASCKFLFMGRIGRRKGVYDIIEACKKLEDIDFEINIYGDGEVEKVSTLVNQASLDKKIKVKGWISGADIAKAYKENDVLILPSYNEGLPMSILEGMSYGMPILSTPVGGIAEAVEDNVNGFLIEAGNIDRLAEKIRIFSVDIEVRKLMAKASYKIASEKFDINIIMKELNAVYNSLL